MSNRAYGLIIIGGGLAGAALARVMAEDGHAVLVLERETRMKDRVRGELMWPWGTAELVRLKLYDTVMESGGHEVPWMDIYRGPTRTVHRDLSTTTTPKLPSTTFYHPRMQEALIAAAEAAASSCRGNARRSTPDSESASS